MVSLMCLQLALVHESQVTPGIFARVGQVSGVRFPHMLHHVALVFESLFTDLARVGSLSGVRSYMSSQVTLPLESLIAMFASKRLLSGVRS